jgi:hypothetical protein
MPRAFRPFSLASLAFTAAALAAVFPSCTDDEVTPTPVAAEAGADTAPNKITCGQPGTLCAGDEWCAYSLVGSCGREGQLGTCDKRPATCSGDCPAVCGCDGKAYCNPCEAQAAGTDVDKARNCFPSGGDVLAYAIYTDPPKLVVFKKDTSRSICLRLTLIARLGTEFGLDVPSGWGVEGGEITNDPEDCAITTTGVPVTPKGTALRPNGGQGRITFSADKGKQGKSPCSLSAAARLGFEPTPSYPWVPNVEALAAQNVTVEGACP